MPSTRAPDNMPTETIERMLHTQEQAYSEAKQEESAALRKLTTAIHAQRRADELRGKYSGWLYYRNKEVARG